MRFLMNSITPIFVNENSWDGNLELLTNTSLKDQINGDERRNQQITAKMQYKKAVHTAFTNRFKLRAHADKRH